MRVRTLTPLRPSTSFLLYVFFVSFALIVHVFVIFEVFIIVGHLELVVLLLWNRGSIGGVWIRSLRHGNTSAP